MKNKVSKNEVFRMRVTLDDKKKITALAKRLGCSRSEAIRRVIDLVTIPKVEPEKWKPDINA